MMAITTVADFEEASDEGAFAGMEDNQGTAVEVA